MRHRKEANPNPDTPREIPPLIECRDITVMRGSRVALNRITLLISLGENVVILGPNGSGKTTFIKTITRECFPLAQDSASIFRIFGKELWNLFELRRLIGVVTSDLANYCAQDYLTPHEVILSSFFGGIGIWRHNRVRRTMEKETQETMGLLEIAHLAERPMSEISTGELRRIIIGRALVHKPQALLLDEPTASLDPKAAHELLQILRKIARTGTSIIMVTHNLPDIIPEIKRVILLKEGRIFKDGDKEEVLTAETLSDLFGKRLEIMKRDGYYYLW